MKMPEKGEKFSFFPKFLTDWLFSLISFQLKFMNKHKKSSENLTLTEFMEINCYTHNIIKSQKLQTFNVVNFQWKLD